MSIASLIKSLPKYELNLRFEAAVQRETILTIADENGIPDQIRRFDSIVELYKNPESKRFGDLVNHIASWIKFEDNLARAVYDMGVVLNKDNIRYAEVSINPLLYVNNDFTYEDFLKALNDGTDRVERAWGVEIKWVMAISRAEPRRADEIARWATSATARNNKVIGIELDPFGKNEVAEFKRPFTNVVQKNLSRRVYVHKAGDFTQAIEQLIPTNIIDGWDSTIQPEQLESIIERNICLSVSPSRALAYNRIRSKKNFSLESIQTYSSNCIVSTGFPTFLNTDLSTELLTLHELGLSIENIGQLLINAIRFSQVSEAEREMRIEITKQEIAILFDDFYTSNQA